MWNMFTVNFEHVIASWETIHRKYHEIRMTFWFMNISIKIEVSNNSDFFLIRTCQKSTVCLVCCYLKYVARWGNMSNVIKDAGGQSHKTIRTKKGGDKKPIIKGWNVLETNTALINFFEYTIIKCLYDMFSNVISLERYTGSLSMT